MLYAIHSKYAPEVQLSTYLGVITVKDELRTLWRSQDIADARAQHGLRLYELLREVQKHLGGGGGGCIRTRWREGMNLLGGEKA